MTLIPVIWKYIICQQQICTKRHTQADLHHELHFFYTCTLKWLKLRQTLSLYICINFHFLLYIPVHVCLYEQNRTNVIFLDIDLTWSWRRKKKQTTIYKNNKIICNILMKKKEFWSHKVIYRSTGFQPIFSINVLLDGYFKTQLVYLWL